MVSGNIQLPLVLEEVSHDLHGTGLGLLFGFVIVPYFG